MRRIADRYVLEEPLGSGGMGSIHRARHELIGQAVAIKLLKRSLLDDPVLRERFHREAVSLAKLRHPGIVAVLDYGESDGDLYMVLELVEGETLERLIERDGSMTMVSAAPLFDQVLAALAFCHENEIVHRDVKPSNVMLSKASNEGGAARVVLIDFGLARVGGNAAAKLTETGAVHGTAQYMSPEQCRGEEVGPPADVYSAGVLFYEMLSGAQPFRGADAATLMAQHLFVEPVSLRLVAPYVSAGVSAAVHAALAKQPHDRPTAGELRDALAAAARGTDPEARAEVAADLRRHVSGLARSERALGGRDASTPGRDASAGGAAPAVAMSGDVLVWTNAMDRGAALRGCLATAGLSSSLSTAAAPDLSAETVAVIVSARDGMERVRNVRTLAPKLPIVVVDVSGPDETTAAIRAGASDMVLRAAPDADLVPKLTRLLKRRARA